MTNLTIALLACLFMAAESAYQHIRQPCQARLIAMNIWAAAFVVLLAFVPA